jgi:hypothetical protein
MLYSTELSLSDKQKEEVDKVIYEQVQENLDDLTVFEDYWYGITCEDGTMLDINIYDGNIYGGWDDQGLKCSVYFTDADMNIDTSNPVWFESEHLDGIDPNTNAQVEVYF